MEDTIKKGEYHLRCGLQWECAADSISKIDGWWICPMSKLGSFFDPEFDWIDCAKPIRYRNMVTHAAAHQIAGHLTSDPRFAIPFSRSIGILCDGHRNEKKPQRFKLLRTSLQMATDFGFKGTNDLRVSLSNCCSGTLWMFPGQQQCPNWLDNYIPGHPKYSERLSDVKNAKCTMPMNWETDIAAIEIILIELTKVAGCKPTNEQINKWKLRHRIKTCQVPHVRDLVFDKFAYLLRNKQVCHSFHFIEMG